MAKIDFFLDFDEVFKGTVFADNDLKTVIYRSSVTRINRLITDLKRDGHDVCVVPVTTYRESKNITELRALFEDAGMYQGLPFHHFPDGRRAGVVTARLAQGETDAFVIFDDDKDAYPRGQENLVTIISRRFLSVLDMYRGISMDNIGQARKFISDQLAARAAEPTRGKPRDNGSNDPSQTL